MGEPSASKTPSDRQSRGSRVPGAVGVGREVPGFPGLVGSSGDHRVSRTACARRAAAPPPSLCRTSDWRLRCRVRFRADRGAYYTPPALRERLLDLATAAGVDWRSARVLDPACGGGAFLSPVARRMAKSLTDCSPAAVLRASTAGCWGSSSTPCRLDVAGLSRCDSVSALW